MGRAHRWNTSQTAAEHAREQDYRDRRRRAALEGQVFSEAAAMMPPADDAGAHLAVELVMRAAADGDETALGILAAREHLNVLGVEYTEDIDDRTWQAVRMTHADATPRAATQIAVQ